MELNPIVFVVALVAVTLWHELGHLLVARWMGAPVSRIYIGCGPVLWRSRSQERLALVLRAFPLGMSVAIPNRRNLAGTVYRSPRVDLWIAAGGPLASLLLTALCFGAARWLPLDYASAHGLVGVGLLSAALALLNLLPIPGLDGGHLVMLAAACRGWELSPVWEVRIQCAGVSFAVLASLTAPLLIWWTNRIVG
jgi:membrane-associated protease RseP (regulator of RpoE activity)